MTALLALVTVLAWGCWIPVAQIVPGIAQHSRTFYVAIGNLVFATFALFVGGGHLSFGWQAFWLPLAGGVVWTFGNYAAFRSTETIGLARAAGSWTPLNIIVAFIWGALLFGELDHLSIGRSTALGLGLICVLVGVSFIVRSQSVQELSAPDAHGDTDVNVRIRDYRRGLLYAGVAGVLWGSYFVPAQWAKVPANIGNFPLAIGIVLGACALALHTGVPERLPVRHTAVQLLAGMLFGLGNVALLGLVARIGTGVGFTIAQLSLVVNVSVGIFVFKVPAPRSHAARVALVGIAFAGVGGIAIGALR